MTNTQLPPPEMTSSEARVTHMRSWVDQLEVDIARLTVQRDVLWQAIAVLDPDAVSSWQPQPKVWPSAAEVGERIDAASTPVVPEHPARPKSKPAKKPAKKAAASPAVPVKRSGSKYDYAKIAVAANAAVRAGTAAREAVRRLHPGISDAMAAWVITEARRQGHLILRAERGGARPREVKTPAQVAPAHGRNWPEIAAHIIEFRSASVPVAAGLAKLYRVPESTARNWMTRCREQGLVPPLSANLRVVEDNTTPAGHGVFDPNLVAKAYLDAMRAGRRPVQTVADQFDVTKDVAQEWVGLCRTLGLLPPAGEPQLPEAERRELLDFQPVPV